MPPRLLGIVIANPGSAESSVFSRVLAHRDAMYDALVVHQDWPNGGEWTSRFERDGRVPLVRLDLGWRPSRGNRRKPHARALSLVRLVAAVPSLYRATRAYRPTLIYSSQQRWDSAVAGQLADRLGLPHIVHLQYNVEPSLGSEVLRRLRTRAHIVAVSDFIRDQAIAHGVDPARVTTIPNAIAPGPPISNARAAVLDEFGFGAETVLLGVVGRLAPSKCQGDVIASFASVVAEFPMARLLVVGEGEDRAGLERLTTTLGIAGLVRFTGQRADVARLLPALDLFVHPSRREPFGLSVLEAMAAGVPVVASAEGAFPEFVDDGKTGVLVRAGDVGDLTSAVRRLLAEPELRRSLGAAARRCVENEFRPGDAGRAFGAVVRSVVGAVA